jgi:NADH dehydrogenase/NADH:ubiquinone oxidoreductase subunit G
MRRLTTGLRRGAPVTLNVDGEEITAFRGETIAAALLASDRRILRRTPREGSPRGLFCVMGICYDCVVTISEAGPVRSCMTLVEDGMSISTKTP